jgi:HK97 family phage portal protein
MEADTRPQAHSPGHDIWYGGIVGATATGLAINEANALEIPAIWKCIKILAESIASLPLILYERDGDARSRATNHPYYDLMHTQPNPEMSSMQYREGQIIHLGLWGDHYAEKQMNGMGIVKALWPLLPNRVTPFRTDNGKGPLAYEYRPATGETIFLHRGQVIHTPGLSYNGVTGLSPIGYNRESLGLAKATQQFGARLFSNDATPGGVLEHPKSLSPEALQRLRGDWNDAYSGLSNAHRVAVLQEGMKFNPISIPPEDAQFLETRKFQDEDIYGMYRIPPHLAGDLEHATYTNIIEQSLEFVVYTLFPWFVRIEQALNTQLLNAKDRKKFFFEHLVDALLRGNPTERWGAYKIGSEIGVLKPNDVRRLENMNPIPKEQGGDDYHIPSTWAVAGAPKELPAPPPAAPAPQTEGPDEQAEAAAAQFRPLIYDVANRITQKETKRVRKLSEQRNSFDAFYKTFPEYVADLIRPTLIAYAGAIQGESGQSGATEFIRVYAETLGENHVRDSRAKIRASGANGAIPTLMDEWEQNRPDEIADREIVAFAEAVDTFTCATTRRQT